VENDCFELFGTQIVKSGDRRQRLCLVLRLCGRLFSV